MAREAGALGTLAVPLGLGVLRLATEGRPSEDDALRTLRAALDFGVRLFDTADVYGLDDADRHYGERLVRRAVAEWTGPRDEVRVATKAGLRRPKGRWTPNCRPDAIRQAVDGSLAALGVERLFLLQLHVRDPKVPFEETLVALAKLREAGKIEHVGLCNTTVAEVQQAQRHFPVACVQNELSVLVRKNASDGLVAWTQAEKIPFLAYRPLGGEAKLARIAKNATLTALGQRRGATPYQMALAAVWNAGPHVIPLVGATRPETLAATVAAASIALDVSDRTALDLKFSFASTAPTYALPPPPAQVSSPVSTVTGPGTLPEVVLLMGIQGAGKSHLVADYVAAGYVRLNRDLFGGKLDDLVPRLVQCLASGQNRVVLDNTYPTRISRAPVVAAARAFGVPVRCRHLQTPLAEAQYNLTLRMLDKYGRPLGPDEMKALAKTDPNLPPPAALGRYASTFEPPALDEGYASVEPIAFVRAVDASHTEKGLLLDVDGTVRRTKSGEIYPRHPDDVELLPGRRDVLARWVDDGYRLFFVSNQSGIASGKVAAEAVLGSFLRTAELLGLPVAEIAYCPHPAFPVGCYCRKPMPGLGAYLIQKHRLARESLVMVGDMESDAAFAASLGARYHDAAAFFDT